jgi:hypothetical protein
MIPGFFILLPGEIFQASLLLQVYDLALKRAVLSGKKAFYLTLMTLFSVQ